MEVVLTWSHQLGYRPCHPQYHSLDYFRYPQQVMGIPKAAIKPELMAIRCTYC